MRGDFEPGELKRLREALDALGDERPDPRRCPHPKQLWLAAHRQLGGARLHKLVDHILRCPACARDWRSFEAQSRPPVVAEPAPSWRRRLSRGVDWLKQVPREVLVPTAAVVLVVAGGVALYFQRPIDRGPLERGGAQEIESLVPADAPLSRQNPVLRWSPISGATSYDVVVATPDLTELANVRGLTAPELRLPPETLADLPPGAEITWQVTVHLTDAGPLTSKTFSTRLE